MLKLFTLAFNEPDFVLESIKHFKKLLSEDKIESGYEWYLVDCHWPLVENEDQDVSLMFHLMAKEHGLEFLRPSKNRGVVGNWNWIMNEVGLKEGDVWIGLDPDERPSEKFFSSLEKVFKNDPNVFYASCIPQGSSMQTYTNLGYKTIYHEAEGVRYFSCDKPMAWVCGGFSANWMIKSNGVHAPTEFYGHIEAATMAKMQSISKESKAVLLMDVPSVHLDSTATYTHWKLDSAQGKTSLDFEAWLWERT